MLDDPNHSFKVSEGIVDALMIKFEEYLYDQKLKSLETPYTAE